MRIYKMTATFGKLEHETLTLKPGLNVITAPNEWGKSTWCAFLVAMLYGLDTRAKTTKTALADKEHYAPWSGSPMSGRIDLNWKGRDITIERNTKRRVPLGEFKAYETESGLPVTELTAANCGQQLLGVEQTVFRRAGFIRHADLPVSQDEALRRRLNALVTTGDESGAADRLAEQLKELKNRCRYNRTGLLPQAEAERDSLESRIGELDNLQLQSQNLNRRLEEVVHMIALLRNHKQALAYQKAQADAARAENARQQRDQMMQMLQSREEACAQLPSREEAQDKLHQLHQLRQMAAALGEEEKLLPPEPRKPLQPELFAGMSQEEALEMVLKDAEVFQTAKRSKAWLVLILMGLLGVATVGMLLWLKALPYAAMAGGAGVLALLWGIVEKISANRKIRRLQDKYGSENCKLWPQPIREYGRQLDTYHADLNEYMTLRNSLESRLAALQKNQEALCGQETVDGALDLWQRVIGRWDALAEARKEAAYAERHYEVLASMVKEVEKPLMHDDLTHPEQETEQLISECVLEQQRLQNRLGQYQGRMESLGDRDAMEKQLARQQRRIAKLEDTYAALTIAQETLAQARAELQRRFAPRITKSALKLLSRMTKGRYNGLTMGQDFSLQARAGQEDTLHEALWRSDGTMDQLYLALRLAVAEELTPGTPLVLDDVLVRFDDERMKAAVEILKELAQHRQILCFTCQGREADV